MRFGYLLAVLTFAQSAHATEMYTFTYTKTPMSIDLIHSFSFSFISPGFITGTQTIPTITPFVVTDGTNMFTLAQGRADFSNVMMPVECFSFADAMFALMPGCGGNVTAGHSLIFAEFSPVPAAPGMYTSTIFDGQFGTDANNDQIGNFNGTFVLTIADVFDNATPEPSGMFLGGTGLAVLAWMIRRRARQKTHAENGIH